jgi:hypothetical protein
MGGSSPAFSPYATQPFISNTGPDRARALRFSLPCFNFYLARLHSNPRGFPGAWILDGRDLSRGLRIKVSAQGFAPLSVCRTGLSPETCHAILIQSAPSSQSITQGNDRFP